MYRHILFLFAVLVALQSSSNVSAQDAQTWCARKQKEKAEAAKQLDVAKAAFEDARNAVVAAARTSRTANGTLEEAQHASTRAQQQVGNAQGHVNDVQNELNALKAGTAGLLFDVSNSEAAWNAAKGSTAAAYTDFQSNPGDAMKEKAYQDALKAEELENKAHKASRVTLGANSVDIASAEKALAAVQGFHQNTVGSSGRAVADADAAQVAVDKAKKDLETANVVLKAAKAALDAAKEAFNRASEAADVARLIIEAAKKDPKQAATLLEKSKELMGDDDRTPTTTPVMDDRKMARETSGTTTFVTVQNVTGLGDFQKQYDSFTGALRHTMAGADDQSQRERMERFLNQINLLEGVSVTPEEHSRFLRLINRAAVLYGIQRHGSCWYYVEPMIT